MTELTIEFNPAVANDLKELKINPLIFQQMRDKIILAAQNLETHTSTLRRLPEKIRKLKFREYRIILWESKGKLYVLHIFHGRHGYSKESFEKILKLLRDYTG